jgi:hypothetical protein
MEDWEAYKAQLLEKTRIFGTDIMVSACSGVLEAISIAECEFSKRISKYPGSDQTPPATKDEKKTDSGPRDSTEPKKAVDTPKKAESVIPSSPKKHTAEHVSSTKKLNDSPRNESTTEDSGAVTGVVAGVLGSKSDKKSGDDCMGSVCGKNDEKKFETHQPSDKTLKTNPERNGIPVPELISKTTDFHQQQQQQTVVVEKPKDTIACTRNVREDETRKEFAPVADIVKNPIPGPIVNVNPNAMEVDSEPNAMAADSKPNPTAGDKKQPTNPDTETKKEMKKDEETEKNKKEKPKSRGISDNEEEGEENDSEEEDDDEYALKDSDDDSKKQLVELDQPDESGDDDEFVLLKCIETKVRDEVNSDKESDVISSAKKEKEKRGDRVPPPSSGNTSDACDDAGDDDEDDVIELKAKRQKPLEEKDECDGREVIEIRDMVSCPIGREEFDSRAMSAIWDHVCELRYKEEDVDKEFVMWRNANPLLGYYTTAVQTNKKITTWLEKVAEGYSIRAERPGSACGKRNSALERVASPEHPAFVSSMTELLTLASTATKLKVDVANPEKRTDAWKDALVKTANGATCCTIDDVAVVSMRHKTNGKVVRSVVVVPTAISMLMHAACVIVTLEDVIEASFVKEWVQHNWSGLDTKDSTPTKFFEDGADFLDGCWLRYRVACRILIDSMVS